MTGKSFNGNALIFIIFSIIIFFSFTVFLIYSGYFEIGLLSDDYLNFTGAQTSSLFQKFTSSVPHINNLHFRPVYYLSINFSLWINQIGGFQPDNFILFRIENLVLFILFIFLSSFLFFKITKNIFFSFVFLLMCLLYPNNLNDICWTVGKNDILCGIFLIATLYFTFYYSERNKKIFYYLSGLFFIIALMTKETSIILPLITVILFYTAYSKEKLYEIKKIIILQFFILILYFLYRILILGVQPAEVVTKFQKPGIFSSAGVVFKSVVSLIIPFDYLSIQEYLKNYNLLFSIYSFIIFIFIVGVFFIFIRTYNFKYLILLTLMFLVSVSPNLIAGYFRPQLILIPFVFFCFMMLLIAIKMSVNVKFYFVVLIILMLFWIRISFNLIQDWKSAFNVSQNAVNSLLQLNLDTKKRNIIIGLPSRFRQASVCDYIMGAYNYKKFGSYQINDKITDLILTGSLDTASLNSEISVSKLSGNEFEILTSGKTQYFMRLDGTGSKYKDKDITLRLSEKNNFNKPVMLRIRITSDDADIYVFSQNHFTKLMENKLSEAF